MNGKDERNKPNINNNSNGLKCCQSNDSLTSVSSTDDINNGTISETFNKFILTSPTKLQPFTNQTEKLNKTGFPKRPPVNIEFENITYKATQINLKQLKLETKEILHNVSGKFESGQLNVIMGPSGAGKSTLLNILAGYVMKGANGIVKINDEQRRDSFQFRKLTAYIPQDEEIRLHLTVAENMTLAAHLKLGYEVSFEYKMNQIAHVLQLLGLQQSIATLSGRLSGGQKKRLAIALELLNNPPILFLDEPTTGLDSLSCSQCVTLLKRLAQEGRTIICTMHQPSALLFEMFDKLYCLSAGHCIYNGHVNDLVRHLDTLGLHCSPYHNPADFLIEVAIGEYNADIVVLKNAAKKKVIEDVKQLGKEKMDLTTKLTGSIEELTTKSPIPANVFMQFLLLYKRNVVIAKRTYKQMLNRIIAHVGIGLLFGYLYLNCGYAANTVLANYVYLYGSMLLLVYTGQMSVTLAFPLEMKILRREHFNRWYKLTPYLLSMLLMEIPFQLLCAWSYIGITYWLTNQPFDFRIFYFIIFCTLCTLCGQAWGYLIGASTPIKIAVFLGPILACLFSIFGFCIRYDDTPSLFRWMYHISYFRAGFHGVTYSIYGYNRRLSCPDDYCHYTEPSKFLREMGIVDVNLWGNMSVIIAISSFVHIATYLTIWFKLNKR